MSPRVTSFRVAPAVLLYETGERFQVGGVGAPGVRAQAPLELHMIQKLLDHETHGIRDRRPGRRRL